MFDYLCSNNNNYDDTASHCLKFGLIKDKYVKRWQQCVKFGCWIAVDESCLVRWYHSSCAIGPDPKPICLYWCYTSSFTCCPTQKAAVLQTVWAYVWRGAFDGDLQGQHEHTETELKFVNQSIWSNAIVVLWKRTL